MGHVLDLPVAERAPAGFDETGFGQAVAGASIESVDQFAWLFRSAIRCVRARDDCLPWAAALSAATTIGKRFLSMMLRCRSEMDNDMERFHPGKP